MAHPNSNPVVVEIDDEWIDQHLEGLTVKSISDRASLGDFVHIEELMRELDRSGGKKLDFIEVMGNLMMSSTCEKTKRTLIHWAALYNKPSILTWILFESGGTKFCYPGSFVNGQDIYGYTALHLAVEANHVEMVKILLKHTDTDVSIAAQNMRACGRNKSQSNGLTPLHFAARNGSLPIVKMLLESKECDPLALSSEMWAKSTSLKTVLHYAAEGGNWQVVRYLLELLNMNGMGEIVNQCDILRQTPLYLAASNGNVEILEILLREGQWLNISTVTWEGLTALDVAKRNENLRKENLQKGLDNLKKSEYLQSMEETKQKHQRIVDMLESYNVDWLQAERQKYANAANCLLVGAALVAGVTYAGWLQPPLGFTQYYEFPTSNPAAPPGTTFESYVGVEQHSEIQMFWFFNSMSFFCSVATFIIGADAGIPDKCSSLREEVVQLRNSVVRASFILSVALLFVIGAFASAGILVLPPIQKQRAPMYVTIAVGVTLCLFLLTKFIRKLKRWFLSPSLTYKREAEPLVHDCSNAGFPDHGNMHLGNVGLTSPDPSVANAKLLDDHQNASSLQHSDVHKSLEEQRRDGSRPGVGSSVQRPLRGQLQAANDSEHSVERKRRPFGLTSPDPSVANAKLLDDHQNASSLQHSDVHKPLEEQRCDGSRPGVGSSVQRPLRGQLQAANDSEHSVERKRRPFGLTSPDPSVANAKLLDDHQNASSLQHSDVHKPLEEQRRDGSRPGVGSSVQRPLRGQLQAANDSEHSVERKRRPFGLTSPDPSVANAKLLDDHQNASSLQHSDVHKPLEEQRCDGSRPGVGSSVQRPLRGQLQAANDSEHSVERKRRPFGLTSPDPSVANAKLLDDHQNASSLQHSDVHKPLEEQRRDGSRPGVGSSVQRPLRGQLQAANDSEHSVERKRRPFGLTSPDPSVANAKLLDDHQNASSLQHSDVHKPLEEQHHGASRPDVGSSVQRPLRGQLQAANDSEHSVERKRRPFFIRPDRELRPCEEQRRNCSQEGTGRRVPADSIPTTVVSPNYDELF